MSCIGESRGFAKSAAELDRQLRDDKLTESERSDIKARRDWFEEESAACWRYAAQEARQDEYDERHSNDDDCEDDDAE